MRTLSLVGCILLAGCAGTTVGRVSNPAYKVAGAYDDNTAWGIRYYESAPFLLVYSDGKGGLVSQLLFLPDLTQKRVIYPYAVLSSNNSTLTFANGVLTQGKTVVDQTVVPTAVVGVLEKVATAALAGTLNDLGETPTAQLPPPQLFRIVLKDGVARLVGKTPTGADGKPRMIDVTISEPDKPESEKPAEKKDEGAAAKEGDKK